MQTWKTKDVDHEKVKSISNHFGFSRPISHILVSRAFDTHEKVEQFTNITLEQLGSPFVIGGMRDACERIQKAIQEKEKIIVHGDFDADGITSSALLTLFLREIGCQVEPFIPNRLEESHGISKRFINLAVEKNAQLVITCDCGSSNEKEIAVLKGHGIDVIITDHHHITQELKDAIVVNPQTEHTEDQPEELSGVGVVFMLLMALRKTLRESGYFLGQSEPNLKRYLDIVALGTIADMAPLIGYNRVLVVKGLEELQNSTRPGIRAMKQRVGLDVGAILHSHDVGFKLAPRLNAAARMGYAMEAFEMIVSDHPLTVEHLSSQMEIWNDQRKKIQNKMFLLCEKDFPKQTEENEILVFASTEFHPGVIGLTAQKICGETLQPCFVFCIEGEMAKGSARARPPYHLVEIMNSVKDLLFEYGGHREAGGCKLPTKHLQEFTKRIQEKAREQKKNSVEISRWVDTDVSLDELDRIFMDQLRKLGPFGIGNPEPLLSSLVEVIGSATEVGTGHLRAMIRSSQGKNYSSIAFGKWKAWQGQFRGRIRIYFHAQDHVWNGTTTISLQIQDFAPSAVV